MRCWKTTVYAISLLLLTGCQAGQQEDCSWKDTAPSVLETILEHGVLRISTSYNTTDYYTYKGITKGFHYELAKDFAAYLGVRLQICDVNDNLDAGVYGLVKGKYDILAVSVAQFPEYLGMMDFSPSFFKTSEVLVQNTSRPLLWFPEQLDGKVISIPWSTLSPYKKTLTGIQDSLKISLRINESRLYTSEDLMHQVEAGIIGYSVIEEHMAQASSHSMHHIDYSLKLEKDIPVSWGLPPGSNLLKDEISAWLAGIRKSGKLNLLYRRYFNNQKSTPKHTTKYELLKKGGISPYDGLLKKEAGRIGWDWRMLAAIVFNESQFDAEAESAMGAYGLMQIIPETAEQFKVQDYFRVDSNIYTGTSYLKYLDDYLADRVPDSHERIKFVLASYNAGPGHILDAMRLAEKYGKNSRIWTNHVDYYIRHKNEARYYRDTLAKNGYCNGPQTFRYVEKVMETYNNYKNIK